MNGMRVKGKLINRNGKSTYVFQSKGVSRRKVFIDVHYVQNDEEAKEVLSKAAAGDAVSIDRNTGQVSSIVMENFRRKKKSRSKSADNGSSNVESDPQESKDPPNYEESEERKKLKQDMLGLVVKQLLTDMDPSNANNEENANKAKQAYAEAVRRNRHIIKWSCHKCQVVCDTMNMLRFHNTTHDLSTFPKCSACDLRFYCLEDYSEHLRKCLDKHPRATSSANDDTDDTDDQGQRDLNEIDDTDEVAVNLSNSSVVESARAEEDIFGYQQKKEYLLKWIDDSDKEFSYDGHSYECIKEYVSNDPGMNDVLKYNKLIEECAVYDEFIKQDEAVRAFRKKRKAEKKTARKSGGDYYSCSVVECLFGSTSMADTMKHEQEEHKMLLLFFCYECRDWFSTKENLIRHQKRNHRFLQSCVNCNAKFQSQYELEHHQLLHHEKSYPCQYCVMTFLKEVELKQHVAMIHGKVITHSAPCRINDSGVQSATTTNNNQTPGYTSKVMIQPRSRVNHSTGLRKFVTSLIQNKSYVTSPSSDNLLKRPLDQTNNPSTHDKRGKLDEENITTEGDGSNNEKTQPIAAETSSKFDIFHRVRFGTNNY